MKYFISTVFKKYRIVTFFLNIKINMINWIAGFSLNM